MRKRIRAWLVDLITEAICRAEVEIGPPTGRFGEVTTGTIS